MAWPGCADLQGFVGAISPDCGHAAAPRAGMLTTGDRVPATLAVALTLAVPRFSPRESGEMPALLDMAVVGLYEGVGKRQGGSWCPQEENWAGDGLRLA